MAPAPPDWKSDLAGVTVPIPPERDQSWWPPATGGFPLTQGAKMQTRDVGPQEQIWGEFQGCETGRQVKTERADGCQRRPRGCGSWRINPRQKEPRASSFRVRSPGLFELSRTYFPALPFETLTGLVHSEPRGPFRQLPCFRFPVAQVSFRALIDSQPRSWRMRAMISSRCRKSSLRTTAWEVSTVSRLRSSREGWE